ncbi:MAG: carboxypeptidase, partial [Rhodocyclaceae bacterium]|nr:carboxypeptidase [Rhodocyclaceae bacterium]
ELVNGKVRDNMGELEGRAYKHTLMSFWTDTTPTADRALMEWMVKGKAGDEVNITARHDKAGAIHTNVVLK